MNKTKCSLCFFAFLIFPPLFLSLYGGTPPKAVACLFICPASAHQPRMIEDQNPIVIENPELSQAFYETLSGDPQTYTIESSSPFLLYVNILVPKSSNPYEHYGAKIYQVEGTTKTLLINMQPYDKKWDLFHEEFAGDDYYQGPEFEKNVDAGNYEIEVYGDGNLGRYVLAVGKNEVFGFDSFLSVLTILPKLKTDFFEVSPLTLLTAKLGIALIAELAILILLSFIFWKLVRIALKKLFKKYQFDKNLNWLHRILRLILALVILIFAIDYWSIMLGIISSFFFYEAASGWCILFSFLKIGIAKQKITKKSLRAAKKTKRKK